MNTKIITIIAVVLSLTLVACGGSTPKTSTSLNGTWKSETPAMTAHISGNSIQIDVVGDGDSALYWKGTLTTPTADGVVNSTGDTAAMDDSLMGSGDDAKQFVYKDGELSFPFSIMGVDQTVVLKR